MNKRNKTLGELMGKQNKDGVCIKCKYCQYRWIYGGNMQMATCPSCSNKNDITENRIDETTEK